MQRIMRMIFALTAVGALAAVAATSALADVNPNNVAYAYSAMQTSVTDKSVAVARTNRVLQVRWEVPGGWKPAKADKPKCHWETGGTNSYINAVGKRIWIDWSGKRAYICPSKTSSTGWRKAGGPPNWEPCGNEFAPPGKPHPPVFRGRYLVVAGFSFTAKVSVRATMSASGSAFAECSATGAYARAYASAYGWGMATASATASGRTKALALGSATTKAVSLISEADVRGKAEADVRVNLRVSAQAQCSGVQPPVQPPLPPGIPQPPSPPQVCPPNTTGTPPNCVPGKDGTQGPGTNVPGQPGGSGAGGSAGAGSGPMCRDASGNLVPGTPDASGNCPGVSSGGTTGGSTPAGPTPPPAEKCLDPATGQQRDMLPGETKDQFGYCLVP